MLGFIGAGNMASAIIKGIFSSACLEEKVGVFDPDESKTQSLSESYGVKVYESAFELAQECDKIVLSVKPNVIPSVLSQIKDTAASKNPLFISIAAGKSIEFIKDCLGYDGKIVRVMPNINAKVGAAVSAYCGSQNSDEKDLSFVKSLCEAFGTAVEITENLFPIFSVIGGCSPAFSYMFIDSLARAAVKNGMTKKQALEVAAQAVLGSAKMILEGEEHPWQLVDQVCSPGGTTIEGVCSLQESSFEAAVEKAVQASFEKDRRM